MEEAPFLRAWLSYSQRALIESRNGLLVDLRIDEANGRAEIMNAIEMLADNVEAPRATVAGDKFFDTKEFVRGRAS